MSPIPTTIIRHIIAVLKLSKKVPQAIADAKAIVQQITNSAYFQPPAPAPDPSLATVSTAISNLETAETAALARTEGAVETRDAKYVILKNTMQQVTAYVQKVADLSPADAEAIILSSGLKVKRVSPRQPRVFSAKNDAISGTVNLLAAGAGSRASHEWQSSTTAANWISLPPTFQAKTKVTGLTPGVKMYFRHRIVNKLGVGAWDQTISLIIT